MFRSLLFITLLTLNFIVYAEVKVQLPETPSSFSRAKKLLYNEVYKDHRVTFYCNCEYNSKREVNLKSCGVVPRKNKNRAKRIEAEHVFPAHQFGNFRKCWREPENVCGKKMSGRKCCEKADPIFEAAHNDLYNLFPAVGEINGDRSNYNWGMIPGEKRSYGECNIEVDSSTRRAEPPENVQGDIARTMFYMSHTYGFRLSNQDIKLYAAWNRMDPVNGWEKERNDRIEKIQKNRNPFIDGQQYDPKKIAKFLEEAYTPIEFTKPVEGAKNKQVDKGKFNCGEKKTCGKMDSCDEALYHLNQCHNKNLDRDNDGIPCASGVCKDYQPISRFKCGPKKTCGEMTSCDEAKYHLNTCENKRLDRNNDGVPCESICR